MYNKIHKVLNASIRWLFMLPLGVLLFTFWYLISPVFILILLGSCDDFKEFKHECEIWHFEIVRDYFKWCIFGED